MARLEQLVSARSLVLVAVGAGLAAICVGALLVFAPGLHAAVRVGSAFIVVGVVWFAATLARDELRQERRVPPALVDVEPGAPAPGETVRLSVAQPGNLGPVTLEVGALCAEDRAQGSGPRRQPVRVVLWEQPLGRVECACKPGAPAVLATSFAVPRDRPVTGGGVHWWIEVAVVLPSGRVSRTYELEVVPAEALESAG